MSEVKGYLAQKKQRQPRTLQKGYALGPVVVLGGWVVSYERGTPVCGGASMAAANVIYWMAKRTGVPRS